MNAVLDWMVSDQRFFSFEIDLDAVERHVPDRLTAVELRPNIGLVSLGWLQFSAGNFGPGSEPFDEVFFGIHVHPDLSFAMPQPPKVAVLVHHMWTTSPQLVRADDEHIHAPCAHEPTLAARVVDGNVELVARDKPIARLATRQSHTFDESMFWGQMFTTRDGFWTGAWQWEGVRDDRMERANSSALIQHDFFAGIDVTSARPYRQMTKGPGIAHERFFAMRNS